MFTAAAIDNAALFIPQIQKPARAACRHDEREHCQCHIVRAYGREHVTHEQARASEQATGLHTASD